MGRHTAAPAALEPLTVTPRKAAELSGLSERTIRGLVAGEKIAYRYFGAKRLIVWRWPDGRPEGQAPSLSAYIVHELPDVKPDDDGRAA